MPSGEALVNWFYSGARLSEFLVRNEGDKFSYIPFYVEDRD